MVFALVVREDLLASEQMFAYPCNDNAADEGVDKKVDGKADSEDIIEAAREAEVVVVQERGVLS